MFHSEEPAIWESFKPLGTSPPVCLSQDSPVKDEVKVLLLGCGDVRNLLFTFYSDKEQSIDATCCDVDPAIIARNIIVLSLIQDDKKGQRPHRIFNIYFHTSISVSDLQTLENQVKELVDHSASLDKWNKSRFATFIRFCDSRTLQKVRFLWKCYSTKGLSDEEKSSKLLSVQNELSHAKSVRDQIYIKKGNATEASRSLSPASVLSFQHVLNSVSETWWATGTMIGDENLQDLVPNPMFSNPNEAVVVDANIDPSIGFPQVSAFVALAANSPLRLDPPATSDKDRMARTALLHFKLWAAALRYNSKKGTVIRFCVAHSLNFCHTLQVFAANGTRTANLHAHGWTSDPLVLDSGDYNLESSQAPLAFDVIDTSNLADYVGVINILVAAAPLMVPNNTSTLYTELLKSYEKRSAIKERVDKLLGGDFRTVSMLLGLVPLETWTNATVAPEVEEITLNELERRDERVARALKHGTQRTVEENMEHQERTRLRWKQSVYLPKATAPDKESHHASFLPPCLDVSPKDLSSCLASIYWQLFSFETLNSANVKVVEDRPPSHTRASFVALLLFLKSRVTTDWDDTIARLISSLDGSIERSELKELFIYLHLAGFSDLHILERAPPYVSQSSPFSTWSNIPDIVCVTIQVPKQNMSVVLSQSQHSLSLCIKLRFKPDSPSGTSATRYSALQIACGAVKFADSHSSSKPKITVSENGNGWLTKELEATPITVSAYVLTRDIVDASWAACCLLPTIANGNRNEAVKGTGYDLGTAGTIFATDIRNTDAVFITPHMPNMAEYPVFSAFAEQSIHEIPLVDGFNIHPQFVSDGTRICGLRSKIRLDEEQLEKHGVGANAKKSVKFINPLMAKVTLENSLVKYVSFPAPVFSCGVGGNAKLSISPATLEVTRPLLQTADPEGLNFLIPALSYCASVEDPEAPLAWSVPRINLDGPILDFADQDKNSKGGPDWLKCHLGTALSAREQKQPGTSWDVRSQFKRTIATMFHGYGDTGRRKHSAFLLVAGDPNELVDGKPRPTARYLILPSAMKIDLANRTVVLDSAIVPIVWPEAFSATQDLLTGDAQVSQIHVSQEELTMWRTTLIPAFVERCRTWKHREEGCEYAATKQFPLVSWNPLCGCGVGKFPKTFPQREELKVGLVKDLLTKYATRVAISPVFAVPYVEDCFYRR